VPTGNLPASGKKLWEEVYDKALSGSCKDNPNPKECAAGSAWKAVKNAGWRKGADGQWHKSANLEEFSLRIEKASFDKATQEMRWKAVASDTEEDHAQDNMTLELFADFIRRIEDNELVPEKFRSDYWQGGLPYLSVSHYLDYDGKGVPGIVDAVYIDGNKFKSNGRFHDNKLGKACFKAVCDDLYGENKNQDNKVRISIAFLDYLHKHKSNGYTFIRESLEDICPECLKELITDEGVGKEFIKGHLIHEALTRVPMNERTSMEVEKSMATRKEDATTIIGNENADELDELDKSLVGKSEALVIKSDDEVVEEAKHGDEEYECPDDMSEEECEKMMKEKKSLSDKPKKRVVKEKPVLAKSDPSIQEVVKAILAEMKENPQPTEQHPLDTVLNELRASFDEVYKSNLTGDDRLRAIQDPFSNVATKIKELLITSVPAQVKAEVDLADALNKAIAPLAQQIGLLVSQLSQTNKSVMDVPQRRSYTPAPFIPQLQEQKSSNVARSETPKLREIIEKTTY